MMRFVLEIYHKNTYMDAPYPYTDETRPPFHKSEHE